MAVGEPDGFHRQFRPLDARGPVIVRRRLIVVASLTDTDDLSQLEELTKRSGNTFAAFIFEPIIQGARGMRIYSPEFLRKHELCRENGILTIADEVFTGFYRTGQCFAFEHAGIAPDLLCLSKGITGGFLPVTLASNEVYSAFLSNEIRTAFLHGHSYTANPIACAAAIESWEMLHETECVSRIHRIGEITQQRINEFKSNPRVKNARSIGTIGAIELADGKDYFQMDREKIISASLERGVLAASGQRDLLSSTLLRHRIRTGSYF